MTKIDPSEYRNALRVGVVVLVCFMVYYVTPFSKSDAGRFMGGLGSVILRVFACMWISSLAKGLGKRPLGYVLGAVLIPAIMLIVVGSMGSPQKSE